MNHKQKFFLLISLVSLALLTAFYPKRPNNTSELTIVNKSGVKLGIQLIDPLDSENVYFLTVEKGSRAEPSEKTFEIKATTYGMFVFYMETWDPVYGYPKCKGMVMKSKLIASGVQRVVFTECNRMPRNPGEPKMMKFWVFTQTKTPFKITLYPYRFIY
ncbi:MAG: hypothetical protein ACPL3P_07080 [Anaerolineales bacterium]